MMSQILKEYEQAFCHIGKDSWLWEILRGTEDNDRQ